jgi:type I restriction enzyme, S subunit
VVGEGAAAERLIEHFDVLVEATGGLKRLKELILDLAVRGALTSDERRDGTADELVACIRGSRKDLASHGIRVRSDLGEVPFEDAPYAVPPGWRWVHLGFLGGFVGGGTPSKSNASFWDGSIPWVSPKDMKRPYIDDAEDHISPAAVESSAAKIIPAPSLLFVVRGMILAHSFPVALTMREVTINQDMRALVLALRDVREFVLRACQAARARVLASVERSSHGTCRLDSEVVETLPIALPPLDEQQRIVAKVDQLMALCDELEARESKKQELVVRFASSAVACLTAAQALAESNLAHRGFIENFSAAFSVARSVQELRAAVLELASRGLLVEQTPAEGAAVEMLREIISRRNAIKPGSTTAQPFEAAEPPTAHPIPRTWTWAPLEVVTHPSRLIRYGILMPGPDQTDGPRYVKVRNMKNGEIDVASLPRTTPEIYAKYAGAALGKGDLLISIRGSYGGVALVPDEIEGANITQDSARIAPFGIDRKFLFYMLQSPLCQRFFASVAKGAAVQGINIGDLRRAPIPLAPLREQRRIVAKVDQLLKMCDNLEATLRTAEDRAARFAEAAVRDLVA